MIILIQVWVKNHSDTSSESWSNLVFLSSKDTDMKNIEAFFPATSRFTYLNTPGIGLISRPVYEFRQAKYDELYISGSEIMSNTNFFPSIREKIASFFNADPAYTALIPSFSIGFNAILEGLEPGQKILLLKNDYPSINWAVQARKFDLVFVDITENLEESIAIAFKKHKPDLFIFSQVQYLNGIKIDPEFLQTLKKDYPDTILIGDGTQYLGTEKFDFKNSGLDVLGASAYKWLGAGLGNGFFMFTPEMENVIQPKFLGFGSVLGKYKDKGETLIGKMEGNHLDPANIGSVKVALDFMEKMEMNKISSRIKRLSDKAKTALSEWNLLEESVVKRKIHSSIFNIKADQALFEKLTEQKIICSQRGEGIRIGLHYYNSEEDLNRFLEAVRPK